MQLLIIVIVLLSLILALIGVTTNYWYQSLSSEFHEGLWIICRRANPMNHKHLCQKQPFFKSQILSIFALVLLAISFIFSVIQRYRHRLAYLTILLLTITTILLIFSYLLYPRHFNFKQLGYSIYLMIVSSLLTFITAGLLTFSTRQIQSIE